VLLVLLTLTLGGGWLRASDAASGGVVSPEATTATNAPIVEFSFYQPEYAGDTFINFAYLALQSDGQFMLMLRDEEQYAGATHECDRVRLNMLSGRLAGNGSQAIFSGSDVDDLTDDCTPSLNHHRTGPATFSWSVRPVNQSGTALEFANQAYPKPWRDFVFRKCIPNTRCQQHYQ